MWEESEVFATVLMVNIKYNSETALLFVRRVIQLKVNISKLHFIFL